MYYFVFISIYYRTCIRMHVLRQHPFFCRLFLENNIRKYVTPKHNNRILSNTGSMNLRDISSSEAYFYFQSRPLNMCVSASLRIFAACADTIIILGSAHYHRSEAGLTAQTSLYLVICIECRCRCCLHTD